MSWISWLEARIGFLGIPRLMQLIALLNGLVYLLNFFQPTYVLALLLIPQRILHGEVWRLVSYIFVPEVLLRGGNPALQPLFLFVYLWFLVWMGDALEQAWGAFKVTLYYFLGMVGVTVAAFLPIGLAQSAAGEYLFSLFAVVAIALIISWFVAAIFTPLIGFVLLPDTLRRDSHDDEGRVTRLFRSVLLAAMRRRRLTVALAVGTFVASMFALALVHRQFFPASDRPFAIGSTNGSAWNATFVFNGYDRIAGTATQATLNATLTPSQRRPANNSELARSAVPIPPSSR